MSRPVRCPIFESGSINRRLVPDHKYTTVLHCLNHVESDAECIGILDADIIMKGHITPCEFEAARGRPFLTPYEGISKDCQE
nr:peptidyl serine alpha-galactosyltransferase-like [Tanacetum cinerariifolium]